MKRLSIMLLCTVFATPVVAFAGESGPKTHMIMMSDADANHDGVIDREEHMAMAAKHFDMMDQNHDGKISADERGKMMGDMGPSHHRIEKHIIMGLDDADTNGDKTVSFDEFSASHTKHFMEMDANHDGFVEKSEFPKPKIMIMHSSNEGADRKAVMEKHIETRVEARFDMADANKDGKVSLEEAKAGQKARFAEWDKNSDGFIEDTERPAPPAPQGKMNWQMRDGGNGDMEIEIDMDGPPPPEGGKVIMMRQDKNVKCEVISETPAEEMK